MSSRTDYVVAGASPGSKLAKAQKAGVEIVDEQALLAMLGEGGEVAAGPGGEVAAGAPGEAAAGPHDAAAGPGGDGAH